MVAWGWKLSLVGLADRVMNAGPTDLVLSGSAGLVLDFIFVVVTR